LNELLTCKLELSECDDGGECGKRRRKGFKFKGVDTRGNLIILKKYAKFFLN
jgi:hypothetical protein